MSLSLNRILEALITVLLLSFCFSTHAAPNLSKSALSAKFQQLVPFKIVEINDHQTGLYEIVVDRGIFYATKDGQHIFSGSVHELKEGLPNLTQQKKADVASDIITHLEPTFVSYPAQQQKHEILVFFDSSCGYCHKLHREITQYNNLGITVHYALYPRSGTHRNSMPTPEYSRLSAVSCAPNKELAMNSLVAGQNIAPSQCDSQVQNHYQLGQWLGVSGTPAIYDMNGNSIGPGYMPATDLFVQLEAMQNG